jgi:hypothetical protein
MSGFNFVPGDQVLFSRGGSDFEGVFVGPHRTSPFFVWIEIGDEEIGTTEEIAVPRIVVRPRPRRIEIARNDGGEYPVIVKIWHTASQASSFGLSEEEAKILRETL